MRRLHVLGLGVDGGYVLLPIGGRADGGSAVAVEQAWWGASLLVGYRFR